MEKVYFEEYCIRRHDIPYQDEYIGYIKYSTYIYFYVIENFRTMRAAANPWKSETVRRIVGKDIEQLISRAKREDQDPEITIYMPTFQQTSYASEGDARRLLDALPADTPGVPLTLYIKTTLIRNTTCIPE